MLWAVAVTMLSIMKPVFGTPQGTGVGPIGGIATQTPTAKMFGYFGFCWCLSTMVKPRGFDSPSIPDTGLMPRNAGSIIEKAKGRSFSAFTDAVVGDLLDDHLAVLDLLHRGSRSST